MKVLIHDGLGIWLFARRLNQGKFHWAETWRGNRVGLSPKQVSALVQGLPWQRLGAGGRDLVGLGHPPWPAQTRPPGYSLMR
ncbi:MAG: IS66 family insertion sequence element accessory protein TnpB [Pseudomonadota bacterium]